MKIKLSFSFLILIAIIIGGCAVYYPPPPIPPPPDVTEVSPNVRIGIAEKLESLTFMSNDDLDIWDQNGRLMASNYSGRHWRVRLADATSINLKYRLLYREVSNRSEAENLVANLENYGYSAVIKQVKKRKFQSGQFETTFLYNIFFEPFFDSEYEARQYQQSISDRFFTTILPFFDSRPGGKVILINEDTGEYFQSPGLIRVRGNLFTVRVMVGQGFHFEREVERTYRKQLEFWIDRFGMLTVVNEIPFEVYLKGVVGSEMSSEFPLEALKAQAVAARSYTLARIDKQHRLSPFDLCDEVHCHVYGGRDKETARVNEAVDRTRGQVLMYNDIICETFYAGVCGGHSENNENAWDGESQVYLRGKLDSRLSDSFPEGYLESDSHVRQWIESSPDVYCNTTRTQVPESLNYTRKYFRWSVRYSKEELSNIIADRTGEYIGSLIEIIPLERGVSGRLKKIEIRGTRRTIIIEKELEIRRVLSRNYLYSSCFVVDRDRNDFIINGAGWGHGVGMCQTGAAMMALEGFNYRDILYHYYTNSKLVKIY